jgi:hypothetical protein
MKFVFSECAPHYAAHLAPYQVWCVLDGGETPGDAFGLGFLPGAYDLSHFYLARSVRIRLDKYTPPPRVRYAARQCADLSAMLTPVSGFEFDCAWREMAAEYFTRRWVRSSFNLDSFARLLCSPLTTHVLAFVNPAGRVPVGLAALYMDRNVGYYAGAVYDLSRRRSGIGGHMMATALAELQQAGSEMVYLGTCYSTNSLYKTRFPGMEFFNGRRWSSDRDELRFLIEHQGELVGTHLLEFEPYRDTYLQARLPMNR